MTQSKFFWVAGTILFVFFIPAYVNFFTNDDFLHLSISRGQNLVTSFRQFPHFRPITTQAYYALSANFFSAQPRVLRLISLAALITISWQVYLLATRLTGSVAASSLVAFLYLTSATHYAHLNYAGAFQELGLAMFILAGCLTLWRRPGLSPLFFILALLSKETAVVYPALLLLLYRFKPALKINLLLHLVILAVYLLFHIYYSGFATGDSYIWAISPQIFNTLAWYGLWSLNLPEMWVDFIGPGLRLNPNLLKFWAQSTIVIFILFLSQASLIIIRLKSLKNYHLTIFSGLWFIVSLGPLLLLPWHKFTFYLTLPLVGVCLWLGLLMSASSRRVRNSFLTIWLLLSVSTYSLTLKTNWITRGAETAFRFHTFFTSSQPLLTGKTLVFYDTTADSALPWSPTKLLKDILSSQNYFSVYSRSQVSAVYTDSKPVKIDSNQIPIMSRQFLGY